MSIPPPSQTFDAAVVIGRFQPPHNAHLELLRHALAMAPRVFVVIGSAHQARSPKSPWTWSERKACIEQALPDADRGRLTFIPVRDYYDEQRWRRHIVRHVERELAMAAGRPAIALIGHFKDPSSSYLAGFNDWKLVSLPRQGALDATAIRDVYFNAILKEQALPADALSAKVPRSSMQFLTRFFETDDCKCLAEEWRTLRDYRQSWASAPYPPVFVTADAIVTCQSRVLLIRRGKAPGKNLLALTGGFVDQYETTMQAALRELREESQLGLGPDGLDYTLRAQAVFDHPFRSQRGRTISHAFHFELGGSTPPEVVGTDDAASARWIEISKLTALEDQFFDDHFHILDHFLSLPLSEEVAGA